MEAIDQKILKELDSLSAESKLRVLQFIQSLSESKEYASKGSDESGSSVSENTEEYMTPDKLVKRVKNLPKDLQAELWTFLDKLTIPASEASSSKKNQKKDHPKFKPGFGGAKGLFVLKEGWDEPLTDLFKDYM